MPRHFILPECMSVRISIRPCSDSDSLGRKKTRADPVEEAAPALPSRFHLDFDGGEQIRRLPHLDNHGDPLFRARAPPRRAP